MKWRELCEEEDRDQSYAKELLMLLEAREISKCSPLEVWRDRVSADIFISHF